RRVLFRSRTGIQMIIFLAGLQTIPPSLYEASSIEGASAWENFWMITIPMISPMILVNLVYTVVDVFTDSTNSVMMMVSTSLKSQAFANAAAMAWIYFAIVGVALAIVVAIYSRMMRKMNI
ncbi:MAG: ABC transporter permease subunit, partial [Eubacteriales bacterium]|nr:ABC transporter permease subunit [Eubacteriales bacterium]